MRELSVKDWDYIGYALYAIYLILALLTSAAFFVCLLYIGAVVMLTWGICRSER